MLTTSSIRPSFATWLFLGLGLACFSAGLAAQGTVVHTLEAFHAPSSVVALPGERTLLVANSGRGEYGLMAGRGAISRVTLGDDDHLTVEKLRFIEGLNGPVAMTLVAAGSSTLPGHTLVVTAGGTWMVDAAGKPLPVGGARDAALVLFDATSGEMRARIPLGPESAAARVLGHAVTDPTAITSDPAGNIYLVDVDGAATSTHRRVEGHLGIVKITRGALDSLARGEEPAPGSLFFAVERSVATAVVYSPQEDALFWGTLGGDLRKVSGGDLSGQTSVVTVAKQIGAIGTLGLTPNGTVVAVSADGFLFSIPGRKIRMIKFRKDRRFLSAGQPAFVRGMGDRVLIILPEQGGGGVGPWRQRVNVVALPASY